MNRSQSILSRFPRSTAIELIQETGNAEADDCLYALANILNISLGEHLRALFLIGSYAEEYYAADSDLDVCLVWKAGTDMSQDQKGWALTTHLMRLTGREFDPMYRGSEVHFYDPLDFGPADHYPCNPVLKLAVKEHSLLLSGDDIRPQIAVSKYEDLAKDIVFGPPLAWIRTGALHGSEQSISKAVLILARALLFVETGTFLFNKQHIASSFAEHIGGPWAATVQGIHDVAYGDMSETDKQKLYAFFHAHSKSFQEYCIDFLTSKGFDIRNHLA